MEHRHDRLGTCRRQCGKYCHRHRCQWRTNRFQCHYRLQYQCRCYNHWTGWRCTSDQWWRCHLCQDCPQHHSCRWHSYRSGNIRRDCQRDHRSRRPWRHGCNSWWTGDEMEHRHDRLGTCRRQCGKYCHRHRCQWRTNRFQCHYRLQYQCRCYNHWTGWRCTSDQWWRCHLCQDCPQHHSCRWHSYRSGNIRRDCQRDHRSRRPWRHGCNSWWTGDEMEHRHDRLGTCRRQCGKYCHRHRCQWRTNRFQCHYRLQYQCRCYNHWTGWRCTSDQWWRCHLCQDCPQHHSCRWHSYRSGNIRRDCQRDHRSRRPWRHGCNSWWTGDEMEHRHDRLGTCRRQCGKYCHRHRCQWRTNRFQCHYRLQYQCRCYNHWTGWRCTSDQWWRCHLCQDCPQHHSCRWHSYRSGNIRRDCQRDHRSRRPRYHGCNNWWTGDEMERRHDRLGARCRCNRKCRHGRRCQWRPNHLQRNYRL